MRARRSRRRSPGPSALAAGALALGALALAGVLAGCSDSGGDDAVRATTTTTRATSTTAATTTTEPPAEALVDAACDRDLTVRPGPEVADDEVIEASGVVVGRRQPSVAWVQNDSGGKPRLYGIGSDGSVQRVDVTGAENVDWEDLAPAYGGDHVGIWIADTGDNAVARSTVQLYRVDEPGPSDTSVAARRIDVRYPDGPHDVEALLADPAGPLYLLTKSTDKTSTIYSVASADALASGTATATRVGSFAAPGALSLITGGDVSADRAAIVLRTYSGVWLYRLGPGGAVIDALGTTPCRGRTSAEVQGEAVGFTPDGRSYVTVPEAGPTHQQVELTTVTPAG